VLRLVRPRPPLPLPLPPPLPQFLHQPSQQINAVIDARSRRPTNRTMWHRVNVPNLLDQASVYPAPSIRLLHSSKINQQQKKKEKKKDDIIWKKKFQLSGACYLVRRVCRTLLLFLVLEMSDICRSLYWWQLSNIEHLEESLRRASNIHIKGKLALFYELISSNFFF